MIRNTPRLAILGAGPIGLEAGLYAAALEMPFTIFERGQVGEHLRQWGHVRLFSPFGMNSTPLGRAQLKKEHPGDELPADSASLTGREHRKAYLEPLAASPLFKDRIVTGTAVIQVGRRGWSKEAGAGDARRGQGPFCLLVRGPQGERLEEADVVLDCTGTYGQHRFLGDGGIPAIGELQAQAHIAYGLDDIQGERASHYADRNVVVIGAGYSAATSICLLDSLARKHTSTWVVWLVRANRSQPLKRLMNDPLRERDQLAVRANTLATRSDGNVEYHPSAVVESVQCDGADRFKVRARCAGKVMNWDVERVIANVGYVPDTGLYRELQVHECYASQGPMGLAAALAKHTGSDCLAIPAQGPAVLRNPEPNFFVLGAKSYGRNTQFLLKTGFEQVRDAFTLIAGKSNLDLYGKPSR
jgi:thioredoxin reductase